MERLVSDFDRLSFGFFLSSLGFGGCERSLSERLVMFARFVFRLLDEHLSLARLVCPVVRGSDLYQAS